MAENFFAAPFKISPVKRLICLHPDRSPVRRCTPKAFCNIAQGWRLAPTLGPRRQTHLPRRGCGHPSSIPDIALVPFQPVQLQELAKLLLEIELLVMLRLSCQVSLDLGRL